MLPQARAAEVNALTVALPERSFQGVGVGAREGALVVHDGGLCGPDVVTLLVAGHVVARLGHEPWHLPAGVLPRRADDPLEILAIEPAGQRARRILLVGVALPLVPEHRAKAARSGGLEPRDEPGVGGTVARPRAVGQPGHAAFDRRRGGKGRALGQPFTHTRRPDAPGDEPHRDVEPPHELVAERRHEAPL